MNESLNEKKAAVFLDRDGTIIEDNGHLYDVSQVDFFEDTIDSLVRLQKYFDLFIITNQSGVSKGLITIEQVDYINCHVSGYLGDAGIRIVETYVCPHQKQDQCCCMKPKPYFLFEAAKKYGINLEDSFVIGDHPHDVELAKQVHAKGVYLLTGHGEKHRDELAEGVMIVEGIKQAADLILSLQKKSP